MPSTHVRSARRCTRNVRPQKGSISGINGIPSSFPSASRVARISSRGRTVARLPWRKLHEANESGETLVVLESVMVPFAFEPAMVSDRRQAAPRIPDKGFKKTRRQRWRSRPSDLKTHVLQWNRGRHGNKARMQSRIARPKETTTGASKTTLDTKGREPSAQVYGRRATPRRKEFLTLGKIVTEVSGNYPQVPATAGNGGQAMVFSAGRYNSMVQPMECRGVGADVMPSLAWNFLHLGWASAVCEPNLTASKTD